MYSAGVPEAPGRRAGPRVRGGEGHPESVAERQHSALQYALCELVNRFALPRRLAWAFAELRTTFGGRSHVPDIAVYRWERIPRTPAGKLADDFIEPPDIVVEIVSPEQSVNALVRRCLWYVDHGVRAALLVDPQDESVLLFRADGRPRVLRQADQIGLSDEIPGFQLTVQALFSVLNVE
ncbi:MAG: Uma2 family endonuclease [Chloroflexi bacterium]|nr:Uma2 family endonuclease [Chloroflexota bacterium]